MILPLLGLLCGAALRVCGSETLGRTALLWARDWEALEPGTPMETHFPGSGSVVQPLLDGTCQVALSSRAPDSSQRARLQASRSGGVHVTQVAWDEVAFFVHPRSPLTHLRLDSLRELWTAPSPRLDLYGRNGLSGTHGWVLDRILEGRPFSPAVRELPGPAGVVRAVASDPHGIGYSGREALHGEVRVLEVTDPDGRPLRWRRALFLLHREDLPASRRFLAYVLSPRGQERLRQSGLSPLREPPPRTLP